MTSEYFQSPHQAAGPPNVTPADSPSSPSNFAAVTPHGRGPAPYDIQDSHELPGEVQAAFNASVAAAGAGVLYPQSPRQAATERLLDSPPGYGDFDILGGFSGQGETTHGWPNDVTPPDGD